MSKYDKKFGFEEDEDTVAFHKSRRLFVIKDGELIVADPTLPYSHPAWFEKEGWMNEKDDRFIQMNTRGMVMEDGEVRFYVGWDFQVNDEAEQQFMPHLGELVETLKLDVGKPLSGGQISDEGFRPRKLYGTISDNLSSN